MKKENGKTYDVFWGINFAMIFVVYFFLINTDIVAELFLAHNNYDFIFGSSIIFSVILGIAFTHIMYMSKIIGIPIFIIGILDIFCGFYYMGIIFCIVLFIALYFIISVIVAFIFVICGVEDETKNTDDKWYESRCLKDVCENSKILVVCGYSLSSIIVKGDSRETFVDTAGKSTIDVVNKICSLYNYKLQNASNGKYYLQRN